ncbi:MAG: 50S ribosomal protein L30 [Gammaproteobacteria bacterium]
MTDKPKLKVTLVRSIHGRIQKHKACAQGLGLRKLNQVSILEDTPCVRGMIQKISYMLKVEDAVGAQSK